MRIGLMTLSGHNDRAVVALCRWAAAAGVPLHAVARDAGDAIYLTDYSGSVFVQRRSASLEAADLQTWIGELRARHGYDRVIVAPSTEYLNRVMLRHRGPIEAAGGVVPLVDADLYAQISDKQPFNDLCRARGIPVPEAFESPPADRPFVAKPRHYLAARSGQVKPYLVSTAAERERFLSREAPEHFFFQAFVEGRSLYLLAHVSRAGVVTACAQENLMQQAAGGSIILARPHDLHRQPAAQPYLDLLRDIRFHGLIMVEVRLCRHSQQTVMIEANPRMWGPMQFMLDAQVDPFAPLWADHGLPVAPVASPARTPARPGYFWSGGLSRRLPPCTYHNYSSEQFVAEYAGIASSDLFSRDDTRRLHAHELADA